MNFRNAVKVLATLGLLSALAACGEANDKVATGEPTKAATSAAANPDGPKVELLDAGAEPRAEIRLKVQEGDVQRSTMTMETQMTMTIDGESAPAVDVPAILVDMKVTVDEVRDDGIIESSFTYDDARVDGTGAAAEQMDDFLKGMSGIGGTLEMTDTGAFVDGDLDLPDDLDETMRTAMESFETQMSNFAIPLPAEEVGLGARWTVTTQTALNGIKAVNIATYEIVERTDGVLAFDVDLRMTAPEQDPELPGLPPGGTVHLDGMVMSGSGKSEVSPDRLLPLSSSSTMSGEVRMTIESDGDTSTMLQKMKMMMKLQPR